MVTIRNLLNIGIAFMVNGRRIDFQGKYSLKAREQKTDSFWCDTEVSSEDWEYIKKNNMTNQSIREGYIYEVKGPKNIEKVSSMEMSECKEKSDIGGVEELKPKKSKKG